MLLSLFSKKSDFKNYLKVEEMLCMVTFLPPPSRDPQPMNNNGYIITWMFHQNFMYHDQVMLAAGYITILPHIFEEFFLLSNISGVIFQYG